MERQKLVTDNLDLPRRLYFARLRHQAAGRVLGGDECIAVGNLELVRASYQWHGAGSFRDYAAKAIFHAVKLAAFRMPTVRGGPLNGAVRVSAKLAEFCDREVVLTAEDAEAITAVMGRLCPTDQQYLSDRLVDGLTFREMGERRGLSKCNALKWFNVALSKARAIARSMGCCE